MHHPIAQTLLTEQAFGRFVAHHRQWGRRRHMLDSREPRLLRSEHGYGAAVAELDELLDGDPP